MSKKEISDIYKISIKEARESLRAKIARNESSYKSLKNKESLYARSIKNLTDIHVAAYKVYMDAPDELGK